MMSVMMSCVSLSAILVFKCFIVFSPTFHCIMHKKLKINEALYQRCNGIYFTNGISNLESLQYIMKV